jgi:hypothetical protein
MARTTRTEVESIFAQFVDALNNRIATSYKDIGTYRLDNNPTYGGYIIEQVYNDFGAVTRPFGDLRRGPSDMWETLHFALATLRVVEHQDRVLQSP